MNALLARSNPNREIQVFIENLMNGPYISSE